ncbi:hypothetical protein [Poseidonibacter lekithochrous]|uniref:hypothetical protein n=1 Tax=Poseidonibacter lekithochrous TaxID=1904463 RepID=UPI0008FC9DC4|nr:hypothetical protein [Poseidonibacter lekithochrous]QKJ23538.1 hypothetical protein ALEK_2281 [Poseidonibacter lekithochrous]
MKVENKTEIFYEELNKNRNHNCIEHESFSEYLEKSIEKNRDLNEEKIESESIKETSVFAEKKTGKRRTDIFDTLIDI